MSSPEGVSGKLHLAVTGDKLGKMTVKVRTDQTVRAGPASHVAIDGDGFHWTQDVSGASCKATASLSAATPHVPATMKGTMACKHGELAFALHKTN